MSLHFSIHYLNTNIGLIYASFLQSVEGMKVICHELTQAADPESTVLEDLIKEADRLVSCLAVMVCIWCIFMLHFVILQFHRVPHSCMSYFDHGSCRFQKPSILAYLGLLRGHANMF